MDRAQEVLKQYFGYEGFREGQAELIEAVSQGRDVLGIMPTGAGKSMCFQIPALVMEGITLVISPLISLMKDQVRALNQVGIHAAFLNSSLTAGQYQKALGLARQGQYKIIYVAPERLESQGFLSFALDPQVTISFLAVDEAHCVSQWGQDFRPSYLKILDFLEKLPYRPVIGAYTATATPDVRDDILDILQLCDPKIMTTGFDRKNLFFSVEKPADKYQSLLSYLHKKEAQMPGVSGIIYCLTRKKVEELSYQLREEGISVTRYHAGLSDEERRQNQEDFIYDRKQVMIATNAFGMGIDKSDVRFVVHYNMPKNMESYYQEAGRAGRDGEPSECVLYYEPMDVRTGRFFIDNSEADQELDEVTRKIVQERDRERLRQMSFYCFTSTCLREYILNYFGEKRAGYCGNCQNCLTQYEDVDISREAACVLSCIQANRMAYGITMIVDILRGSKGQRILSKNLDENPGYGKLAHLSVTRLRQIIREMEMQEFLSTSDGDYPVLVPGPRAEDLASSSPLIMKLAKEQEEKKEESAGHKRKKGTAAAVLSEADNRLFEELRALRREIAREEDVPPYLVFSDKTLVDMCVKKPEDEEQMLGVSGVGRFKLEKYAKRFLACIRQHGPERV